MVGTPTFEQAYNYTPPPGFRVVRRLSDGSLLMRVTARPAPAFANIAEGFSRDGRRLTRSGGTLLACATAAGDYTYRSRVGAFPIDRRFRIGKGLVVVASASQANAGSGRAFRSVRGGSSSASASSALRRLARAT